MRHGSKAFPLALHDKDESFFIKSRTTSYIWLFDHFKPDFYFFFAGSVDEGDFPAFFYSFVELVLSGYLCHSKLDFSFVSAGSIDEGDFPGVSDSLYCRLCWVYGQDWSVTAGQEEGISQVEHHTVDCRVTKVIERKAKCRRFPVALQLS